MSWDGSLGEALRLASASPQDRAAPGDRLGRECGAEDDISPGVAGREEAVVVPLVGAWGRDQGSELADEADAVEQDGVGSVPQATLQSVQHATIFQQGQTFCGERGAEEPRAVGYRRSVFRAATWDGERATSMRGSKLDAGQYAIHWRTCGTDSPGSGSRCPAEQDLRGPGHPAATSTPRLGGRILGTDQSSGRRRRRPQSREYTRSSRASAAISG